MASVNKKNTKTPPKKKTDSLVKKDKVFYQELMCAAISSTPKGLKRLCSEFKKEDPQFPSHMSFIRWIAEDELFCSLYTRAKECQTELMEEEIISIADDDSLDMAFKPDGTPFVNTENIQRSRLRVDTRKWLMSKLKPKKYGERTTVAGDDESPLKVVIQMTPEDIAL